MRAELNECRQKVLGDKNLNVLSLVQRQLHSQMHWKPPSCFGFARKESHTGGRRRSQRHLKGQGEHGVRLEISNIRIACGLESWYSNHMAQRAAKTGVMFCLSSTLLPCECVVRTGEEESIIDNSSLTPFARSGSALRAEGFQVNPPSSWIERRALPTAVSRCGTSFQTCLPLSRQCLEGGCRTRR